MSAPANTNRPLDVTLVGAGWIAEHAYAAPLAERAAWRVRHVVDPDLSRARSLAARLDAVAVPSLSLALEQVRPEAVVICTPPAGHASAVALSLAHEAAVLCEKPVFRRREELLAVDALVSAGKTPRVMGSAAMRFRADVGHLIRLVEEGHVGRPHRLLLAWRRHQGVPAPGSWRTLRASSPAGVLEDLGPHLLDVAVALLSAGGASLPERVAEASLEQSDPGATPSSLSTRSSSGEPAAQSMRGGAAWFDAGNVAYDAPDRGHARLVGDGVEVEVDLAWTDETPGDLVSLRVEGDRGEAGFEGLWGFSTQRRTSRQEVWLAGRAQQTWTYPTGAMAQVEAFAASVAAFARHCRGHAPARASWRDVQVVTGWLEDIDRCAEARRHERGGS
jgi:predicted dehydrogenase